MPVREVNAVAGLNDKREFSEVSDQLFTVIDSSMLGEKMFGWAAKHLLGERVDKILKSETEELGKKESITFEEFHTCFQSCMAKLQEIKGIEELPEKRTVQLSYRGWALQSLVSSLTHHAETHLMVALRGWAVEAGSLDALPGEAALCTTQSHKKIEDKLLHAARACRGFCVRVLKSESCKSGDEAEVGKFKASDIRSPYYLLPCLLVWENVIHPKNKTWILFFFW